MSSSELECFESAPIKLAALINTHRLKATGKQDANNKSAKGSKLSTVTSRPTLNHLNKMHIIVLLALLPQTLQANLIRGSNSINSQDSLIRHQAHYLNVEPSSQFSYKEGRQLSLVEDQLELQSRSGREEEEKVNNANSHIYKRSSAFLSPLSDASQARWTSSHEHGEDHILADLIALQSSSSSQIEANAMEQPVGSLKKRDEAELLRQNQHIQYHDQWPSMAGKCHKRTLNFCASVLPFNTTTFPNIIGDTNRFEVKRSLPFFGFLAKSSCNKRLDELLCLLLEPPCSPNSGVAVPPCKKFCRLALEGCNEYIPATLAMSSVFDCRQYPDSSDPNVCINLAQGSRCAADEFKCPDKTCIPRNWLCDGVRDCIFAADEANCTGVGLQSSVCSTEEFTCDGKCVPKAWKCDGERDCLDGSDEESCDQRPRCGPDRFRCADGNGCLPKRWVCDGKAECRDGSDEVNCQQLECSENDFKCDNGICIPKLWRCDRQFDCKDGSDERSCIYQTASPTTSQPTTSSSNLVDLSAETVVANSTYSPQSVTASVAVESNTNNNQSTSADQSHQSSSAESQQVEVNVNDDVSRIIRQESAASPPAENSQWQQQQQQTSTIPVELMLDSQRHQQAASKGMKKFDYDIIQSTSPKLMQLNDLMSPVELSQKLHNQIDFVPSSTAEASESTPARHSEQPPSVGPQVMQPERLPIYRSLFKTFKSGQTRIGPSGHRHVLAGSARKRRERHAAIARQTIQPEAQLRYLTSIAPSDQPVVGQWQQHQSMGEQNQRNQNGVASYLQLLNSRYNLRLARVNQHQQQQASTRS